jgi:hypothetical protein
VHLWGVAPVLAAVLIGGGAGHPATAHAAAHLPRAHSPARVHSRSDARARSRAAAPAPSPPTLAATTGILRQGGWHRWNTTATLVNSGTGCPEVARRYWLVTTSPDRVIRAHSVAPATGARKGSVPCSQVTVYFRDLWRAPESALLEYRPDGAAAPSSAQLTVSRGVSLREYVAIPLAAGAGMMALLFACVLFFVKLYRADDKPIARGSHEYWRYIVFASGSWTANDSWATNIGAIVAFLGTVLAATSAANSLFPGVALDRFAILTGLAGAIVASVPLLFAPLYARWTARNPGVTADSVIGLTVALCSECGGRLQAARCALRRRDRLFRTSPTPGITQLLAMAMSQDARFGTHPGDAGPAVAAPAGATITVPAGAAVASGGNPSPIPVKLGTAIPVPLNGRIQLLPGRAIRQRPYKQAIGLVLPGGPDILAAGDTALLITCAGASASGGLTVPGSAIATTASAPGDQTLQFPVIVTAPAGVKITVTGAGSMTLPAGAKIATPHRDGPKATTADRMLPVPQPGSSALVANMRLVLIPALMTMLGVGAELGIAGVLAFGFSDGSLGARCVALAGLAVIAAWTIYYSTTAIRALADPQPGSSMSSSPGTSFTL